MGDTWNSSLFKVAFWLLQVSLLSIYSSLKAGPTWLEIEQDINSGTLIKFMHLETFFPEGCCDLARYKLSIFCVLPPAIGLRTRNLG